MNASANALQIAHDQYREALMRHRYKHGHTLDQIVSEFGCSSIEMQLVLEDVMTASDQIRVEAAIKKQLAPVSL